ncbi:MAG TPA: hypothetical protein VEQ66_13645 [Propionibacteriaceae bacterium]|nr:hypothetical protein [Propionibacteriaceae bacterium]
MASTRGEVSSAILIAPALLFFTVGLWMVFDPAGFQRTVGGFGTTNEHLIRDLATFNLALAAVLGVAATRPSWRLPVLWFANIQNTLHLVNHISDADLAEPLWLGMANVWALLATGAVLAVLLAVVYRSLRTAEPTAAGRSLGPRG